MVSDVALGTFELSDPEFWIAPRDHRLKPLAVRAVVGRSPNREGGADGRDVLGKHVLPQQREIGDHNGCIEAEPLYATARFYERVEPMQKALVRDVRPAILALMGAVIFLLLIACANVANLLLVRASLRRPELAVRSALGAGRWRIMQQMLAEAVLLTAIGVGLGLLGSLGLTRLIVSLLFGVSATDVGTFAVVSALLFGIAGIACWLPARRASGVDPIVALRQD